MDARQRFKFVYNPNVKDAAPPVKIKALRSKSAFGSFLSWAIIGTLETLDVALDVLKKMVGPYTWIGGVALILAWIGYKFSDLEIHHVMLAGALTGALWGWHMMVLFAHALSSWRVRFIFSLGFLALILLFDRSFVFPLLGFFAIATLVVWAVFAVADGQIDDRRIASDDFNLHASGGGSISSLTGKPTFVDDYH